MSTHSKFLLHSLSDSRGSIAVFGSTGGCINALTALALQSEIAVRALVRNREKLVAQLLSQEGITRDKLDSLLTVVQGDATNVEDIKRTLVVGGSSDGQVVKLIASGIGSNPKTQFSFRSPIIVEDPFVCRTSANAIVTALSELQQQYRTDGGHGDWARPDLVSVSTTGISSGPEDVPLGLRFLYHYLLAVPHEDKKEMEEVFKTDDAKKVFGNVEVVRCSLLTGTGNIKDVKGLSALSIGTEEKPSVGYSVNRADVGNYIFETKIRAKESNSTANVFAYSVTTLTS